MSLRTLKRIPERLASDPRSLNLSERLLATVRGRVSPILVGVTRRSDYDIRRTLIVAGFPRSGTTWLSEILLRVPRTGLVFEPLDIRRVRPAEDAGFGWENFVTPDQTWPSGQAYLQAVLAGRLQTPWTSSHLPVSRAWRVDRWVVKLVRANQMLAWIVANFEVPPPVLLIRHPCAVYDSWIRRGWPIHQGPPPETLRFFTEYPQFREVVLRLRSPEEYFAADWCMHHVTPLEQLSEGTYQLCLYEDLKRDGPATVRKVLDCWKLPWPEGLEATLLKPSAKASGQVHSGATRSGGWRARMNGDVVERMMKVLRDFGIELYS